MGKNKILYHYTSLNGFNGIIKSQSIWLSNSMKMNDYREMNWVIDVLNRNYPNKANAIQTIKANYEILLQNFFKPHIASFSLAKDKLSQWRGYGNDAKGISLGFNLDYFKEISNSENKEFSIEVVIYNPEEQNLTLREYVDKSNMLDSFEDVKKINEIGLIASLVDLFKFGVRFKNSSFKEEKEIRLVHGNSNLAAEPDMLKYRFTDDDIITYLPIELNQESIECPAITEIIIGPKSKISKSELKQFLHYSNVNTFNITIEKSKSTYR